MPQTKINPADQINASTITRAMLNTATSGAAVIRKVIVGDNIQISAFTGADSGTGDVTLTACENVNGVIAIGSGAAPAASATSSISIGVNAGNALTSGAANISIGTNALLLGTGANNVLIGSNAGPAQTTASGNVGIGTNVLLSNTANNLVAIGLGALATNVSGTACTAVGTNALHLSTGANNTSVGSFALATIGSGTASTAVGASALNLATGINNTSVGSTSSASTTTGANNTAIGRQALNGNDVGGSNVAVGVNALLVSTGDKNTAVGINSGSGITSGSNNSILGGYVGTAAPISATGSGFVVLSDGLGNIREYFDSSGNGFFPGGQFNILSGATLDVNSGATLSINSSKVFADFDGTVRAGNIKTPTGIGNVTTLATGGVTLTGQTLATTSVWRIQAYGTITSGSSATARNAIISAYWGSTQLTAFTLAVKVSSATTLTWELQFDIKGTSTTAAEVSGKLFNNIVAGAVAAPLLTLLSPTNNTGLTAGAQTIDLRFGFSVAVTSDAWSINDVSMERIG